ncbi:hypothetical protein D3C78_896960 [compost metagenome]
MEEISNHVHNIDIVLFHGSNKFFPVKENLEKWYAKGEELTVINLDSFNTYTVEGAVNVSNNSYATSENGMVKFKTNSPVFVVEELK